MQKGACSANRMKYCAEMRLAGPIPEPSSNNNIDKHRPVKYTPFLKQAAAGMLWQ